MVECAERLLEEGGYVRAKEVIAIVAGTRTKSGSTNFLRLHSMGEAGGNRAHTSGARSAASGVPKKKPAARAAK
jgi:pyruvate kinase